MEQHVCWEGRVVPVVPLSSDVQVPKPGFCSGLGPEVTSLSPCQLPVPGERGCSRRSGRAWVGGQPCRSPACDPAEVPALLGASICSSGNQDQPKFPWLPGRSERTPVRPLAPRWVHSQDVVLDVVWGEGVVAVGCDDGFGQMSVTFCPEFLP